jgi:predicted phage-related endonuclease
MIAALAGRAAAVELLPAGHAHLDNPRWHELRRRTDAGWSITASEIPAVCGLDQWTSPFSLWWQKREGWRRDDNQAMLIGRVLEAGVLELFARTHPDLRLAPGGLYAHPDRRWQMATPDAIARRLEPVNDSDVLAAYNGLLRHRARRVTRRAGSVWPAVGVGPYRPGPAVTVQAKTAARLSDEWGPDGTDDIPVGYRAQVLWEVDVYGAAYGYLAVLFLQNQQLRWYRIDRDEKDLRIMLARAEQFRRSLDNDEAPAIDAHPSTLPTVKKTIDGALIDEAVEIPAALAAAYRRGLALARRVAAFNARTEARLRAAIGPARYASRDGVKVASRSVYPHHISGKPVDKLTPARRVP